MLGFLVFFLNKYYVEPIISEMTALQKKVAEENDKLTSLRKDMETFKLPDQRYIGTDSLEEKNQIKKLPYVMDVPGLFIEFNYLFIVHALKSSSLTFSEPTETDTYSSFKVNFDVRGKKEDIEKFLKQIEQFRRLVSIKELSLRLVDDEEASLSLMLEIFFYTEGEVIQEPSDYDFMEARYGVDENFMDLLKNIGGMGGS